MHDFKKYIEKVDMAIEVLVKEEADGSKLSIDNEKRLHVLFENCKHANEYMEWKHKQMNSAHKNMMPESKATYAEMKPTSTY